jgi:hypothetical protein
MKDIEMTTTEKAKATLEGLEGKLAAARAAAAKIDADIKSIAFAAHTSGGEDKKRLDALNAKAASTAAETVSLETAIVEAKRRVSDALAADSDERGLEDARTALAMVPDFNAAGKAMDDGLTRMLTGYAEATRIADALRKIGYPPATVAIWKITLRACVVSKLLFTDFQVEHLAPRDRKGFAAVFDNWTDGLRSRIEARLAKQTSSRAA